MIPGFLLLLSPLLFILKAGADDGRPGLPVIIIMNTLGSCLLIPLCLQAETARHSHYLSNRPPLVAKPYTELPLGSIQAEGWLENQLTRFFLAFFCRFRTPHIMCNIAQTLRLGRLSFKTSASDARVQTLI